MTSALKPSLRKAVLLLHDHGPLHVSTGHREGQAWRYIRPNTAEALRRRGLVGCGDTARLTLEGKALAIELSAARAAERRREEHERLAARAEGMPPPPRLRIVRGD